MAQKIRKHGEQTQGAKRTLVLYCLASCPFLGPDYFRRCSDFTLLSLIYFLVWGSGYICQNSDFVGFQI